MSVIRKIPFIQTLIEDLSDEEKQDLLDAINGSGATINASTKNMPLTHITPVLFQFNEIDSKTGILVLSDNYRVLIAYHRFQDLLMFKINSDDSYEKVNEYLDINELRRLLENKEGINVVANPELVGTESALEGLQVGETKYKVGGGSEQHCYCISIIAYIENSVNVAMRFNYYSDNNAITDKATFTQDLYDKGFTGSDWKRYYIYGNGDNQSSFQYNPKLFIAQYLAAEASTTLKMYFAAMSYDTQNNVFVQSNHLTTVSSVSVIKVY